MSAPGGWRRDPETGRWVANPPREQTAASPGASFSAPPPPASWAPSTGPGPSPDRPSSLGRIAERAAHDPRRWIVLGVVAFVVVAVTLVVTLWPAPTMTVRGTVTVRGALLDSYYSNASCSNGSGPTRTVTVFDDSGAIVGSTDLGSTGVGVEVMQPIIGRADSCRYSFVIPDVASGSSFYHFSATGDSGEITRSAADLEGIVDITVD